MDEIGEQAARAALLIKDKLPAIVLTGAGISVESGIPPFRGPGGLWELFDVEEYGHIDTFREDPEKAWKMLEVLIRTPIGTEPNEAHRCLARMEERGWVGPIVTQNIDGFHALAGSRDVLEVHGNGRKVYCARCGHEEYLDAESIKAFTPVCPCGGWKRPDVVFYGEQLPVRESTGAMEAAMKALSCIVIGTSGLVYPAAAIPEIVSSNGGVIVEINTEPGPYTERITDMLIRGPATLAVVGLEEALEEVLG